MGRTNQFTKSWVRESSRTLSEILAAPMDRLEVWVTEIDPELLGIGGVPASIRRAAELAARQAAGG